MLNFFRTFIRPLRLLFYLKQFNGIQGRRQRTNTHGKYYLVRDIVHLCFPLNKFNLFYKYKVKVRDSSGNPFVPEFGTKDCNG